MDKYQSALIEYAKTKKALTECSRMISVALDNSRKKAEDTFQKDRSGWPVIPKEWAERAGGNLWLHLAYECQETPYDGVMYKNHDNDIEGFLAEKCHHALSAHKLIQDRKKLRHEHGIAKRRLTLLSNKLLSDNT